MDDGCRQVLHELELDLDGECADELQQVLGKHLQDCPPCWDRAEFQSELRRIIASKCTDCAPPGLVERVTAILDQR